MRRVGLVKRPGWITGADRMRCSESTTRRGAEQQSPAMGTESRESRRQCLSWRRPIDSDIVQYSTGRQPWRDDDWALHRVLSRHRRRPVFSPPDAVVRSSTPRSPHDERMGPSRRRRKDRAVLRTIQVSGATHHRARNTVLDDPPECDEFVAVAVRERPVARGARGVAARHKTRRLGVER